MLKVKLKKKAAKTKPKASQEVTRLGGALRMLGGLGGRALGGMIGYGDLGASAGTDLGAAISRWLGSGDYTISSNSLVTRVSANGTIPSMHRDGQTIVVRHKEFLTEVTGSTSFQVLTQYSINPGLITTFPWLSGIASQYSEYRIKGMVYHYIPTSGNAVSSTNAALGTVMLQTSYRASEPAPTSKVELLNEYWSSESKPSEPFCHPIECDPKENPFNVQYIRIGAVPSGDSVLMYDLGKTTLAVSGQQANGIVLGDLWVTYEIELRKPVLTDLTGQSVKTFTGAATQGVNAANSFGVNFAVRNSSFQVTPTVGTNTVTFPPGSVGTYVILVAYDGTVTAAAFGPTTITGSGSSIIPFMGDANGKDTSYSVGLQNPFNAVQITITQQATTTVVTFVTTTMVGAGGVQLFITEANPTVL
jgi:hypothetical protein